MSATCLCGCGTKIAAQTRNRPERGLAKGDAARWACGHNMRGIGGFDPRTRITNMIEVRANGCWLWPTGMVNGYGQIQVDGVHVLAHRWVYEVLVGPIPEGLTLDHSCHTDSPDCPGGRSCQHRRCVNPAHMAPMASRANSQLATLRRIRCRRGHEFNPANTFITKAGRRSCRACRRVRHADIRDHVNALARERWARRTTKAGRS